MRTYQDLVLRTDFLDRFQYLRLDGVVGAETFGYDRFMNQGFYKSRAWREARDLVISRDEACDLGDPDRPIYGRILVHHMNPIAVADLVEFNDDVVNPGYLITVSHDTHNAIHYGDIELLHLTPPERLPGDTIPWR